MLPRRNSLMASVYASHAVGRGFTSRPGHTKDHHKTGTNCPPPPLLGTHALW